MDPDPLPTDRWIIEERGTTSKTPRMALVRPSFNSGLTNEIREEFKCPIIEVAQKPRQATDQSKCPG